MNQTIHNQYIGEMALIPMEDFKKLDALKNELIKYQNDAKGCLKIDLSYGRKLYFTKEDMQNDIQKEIDQSARLFKAYRKELDKLSKMSIFKFFFWKRAYRYTVITPLKENEF